jgi:peptide/nickel transport system ATP-binding protein
MEKLMEDLLEVQNLCIDFAGTAGGRKLDHVSFSVQKREFLCIVGESGCGKSITALATMGLLPAGGRVTEGSILYAGRDLTRLSEKQLDEIRGRDITMIFQDALTSLNPVFTIGNQMIESVRAHNSEISRKEAAQRSVQLLEKVGLPDPETLMAKYPFVLSGGQRQRVMIAMALASDTKLLIADEPTTALDVTIQAQIMTLLRSLQQENGMSVLLITHDLGLVAQMADRVLVMYAGQIVESAGVHELFHAPTHPYTQALLKTVPSTLDGEERVLMSIPGNVPEDYEKISGCRFRERCAYAHAACRKPQELRDCRPGHCVRCVLAQENGHD